MVDPTSHQEPTVPEPASEQLLSSAPDFRALEQRILQFWDDTAAFDTLRKEIEGRPVYRFLDGPITANNPMGVHHAWGRTLKDVFIRYHVANGRSAFFQNGFDCQGLWLEVEVEKALGFSSKSDIEHFGLDSFSRKCRQRVDDFSALISNQSRRLGQWMDWPSSYRTDSDANILGIWHFLKKCHTQGWLYRKGLPMPWCPRCGTSLSEHEMAGSHRDTQHLSVFVKVPLQGDDRRALVIWTTTPWTLAANVAIAVNPELEYAEVTVPGHDRRLIICRNALFRIEELHPEVHGVFPGRDLVGLRYRAIFEDLPAQQNVEHTVVPWGEVDATEGTGLVHIAPGCGREDYDLGTKLGLATLSPVDEAGCYFDAYGWLAGRSALDVAEDVAKRLREAGRLLEAEMYTHAYPVCWRCKGELIFRLVEEWFISTDEIRPRLRQAAQTVQWMPDYMGKRMDDWLQNMGHWCISRKRYWGLPLPFYECSSCRRLEVIGSREELRAQALDPVAVDALQELHRPWIDEVLIRCPQCGGSAARVREVGDCWLDAGIVPFTTLGYFDDRKQWETLYPAEWICEMREQIRLWFYSMLFMGVTLTGRAPYEKVLAYERVISEDGSMFSKTGFMIRFDEAVEKIGADSMRYLFCASPVASDLRFGYRLGEMAQRKLLALWNTHMFLRTYAEIDRPQLLESPRATNITDRWLYARTGMMVRDADSYYRSYDTPGVIRVVDGYLEDVSNWYVRVNRRRFWRSGHEADKNECYTALFRALRTVVRVMAPITPFITEEIWQTSIRMMAPEDARSVHFAAWPSLENPPDEALIAHTGMVLRILNTGRNLREQAKLRTRQPLSEMYIGLPAEELAALEEFLPIIRAELNIKHVRAIQKPDEIYSGRLALNFRAAGPVLKGEAQRAKQVLADLPPAIMETIVASFDRSEPVSLPGFDQELPGSIFLRERVVQPHLMVGTE
jgi:isoleucyl-tRNA synthetase